MLDAAARLFAAGEDPARVTMDAVAVAAGVGKATLFRAFGSRDALLASLWDARIAALRERVECGAAPFDAAAPAVERLVAFLDGMLSFKLDNRHLIRALELGTGLLQSPHYRWMHGVVRALVADASPRMTADAAVYVAHALLAALHVDLIEEMLAAGIALPAIRQAQAARVRAVADADQTPRAARNSAVSRSKRVRS